MLDYQKITKEYLEELVNDPSNCLSLWIVYVKFYSPAIMLDIGDNIGTILKSYTLNGINPYNICKPYK